MPGTAAQVAQDATVPVVMLAAATVAVALLATLGLRLRREGARATTALRTAAQAAERLSSSELRFRQLAESSPVGIFHIGPDGGTRWVNPRLREIWGEPAEVGDDAGAHLVHDVMAALPQDRERLQAEWERAAAAHAPLRTSFQIHRPDGAIRCVRVDSAPLVEDERVTGWVGTMADITGELALQERMQRMSEIIEATPDLVAMVDVDGHVKYVNDTVRRLCGIVSETELAHHRGLNFYAQHSRRRILDEAIPAALEHGSWTGEVTVCLPGQQELPASQVLIAHRRPDGGVAHFSTVTRDLTERKRFEAQLLHQGLHDSLTGLPNRLLFLDRLGQALARSARYNSKIAVLFLDVDRFKLVNDSFGHLVGDQLLERVANRLGEALRSGDTAARVGGDEFTVLCEGVHHEEEAREIADRLTAVLAAPYELAEAKVFLTVSIGIALSAPPGPRAETMLRDAGVALRRAKERGGARHELFDEEVRADAVHRLRTANDLHRALEENEFRLVYQPEICIQTGHIRAVEALLRWHHPERGLVSPTEFIPLAEETGLIHRIGGWVLAEAVAQAGRWRTGRHDQQPVPVWVNLSARQLAEPHLVATVARALEGHGVHPGQLGLEITETALLEDADAAIAALGALRALGVQLAVDDFGTGYSSLSYLKRLPVDAVKIDQSFVDGLGSDGDDTAIVTAVVGMARALRLTAIAEGVESREQLAALRALGCEMAQGYYFAVPQPPETISGLLAADARRAQWAPPRASGASSGSVTPLARRRPPAAGRAR